MEGWFSDWGFWEVTVGVIALGFTVFYFVTRNRKELSYEVLTNSRLISYSKDIENRLEIRFDGKVIRDAYLVELKVLNSGNQPISIKDFEGKPLKFVLEDRAEVIVVDDNIKTQPGHMTVLAQGSGSEISIEPVLLNKGWYFVLKFYTQGKPESIKGLPEIVGIPNLKDQTTVEISRQQLIWHYIRVLPGLMLATYIISSPLIYERGANAIVMAGLFSLFLLAMAVNSVMKIFKF